MKKVRFVLLTLVIAALHAAPAQAQLFFGPMLSWGDDVDLAIGGKIGAPIADLGNTGRKNVDLVGSFDWFLDCNECTYFEITGTALYNFDIGENVRPYAGGGLNYGRFSTDLEEVIGFDYDNSEIGLALAGGLKFLLGTLNADASARITLGGAEQAVLGFAILFGGGGGGN